MNENNRFNDNQDFKEKKTEQKDEAETQQQDNSILSGFKNALDSIMSVFTLSPSQTQPEC